MGSVRAFAMNGFQKVDEDNILTFGIILMFP